ncbi:MAG: ABC transporter substrate-binding protein [Clostridia bacterium]|nr:ABC transporter substrate-binding protein [Clostridia bacterium]
MCIKCYLRYPIFIIIIFAMLLSFCACKVKSNDNAENIKNENPITFTDALGRTVTVQKQPKRVAALIGSFADVWTLAGGTLVAAPIDAWEDFELELDGAVNIGGAHSPSLELLLSAAPDFVLASAATASNVALQSTLEAAGITIAYFDVDNFNEYLEILEICTKITGRNDLYIKNGLELQAQIEAVKVCFQSLDLPESNKRILLLRASSTTVKAKGSTGTVLGEMLADMGCINIADNDKTLLDNLSMESVLREDPHHIFVVTMGSNTEAAQKSVEDMILNDPAWKALGAVKHNRLHFMDKRLYNLKPNARWAEAYEKLYEKLTQK